MGGRRCLPPFIHLIPPMTLSSPLVDAFSSLPLGLCGQHDPARLVQSVSSVERRLNLLTLGAVASTNLPGPEQWAVLVDHQENWLFDPSQVAYKVSQEVTEAIVSLHIGAPQYIGRVWWQVCRGVQGRFKGSWRALLEANADDCAKLIGYFDRSSATFPVLSGPVVSVRWLDLIHRIGGVPLTGWESLAIPLASSQLKMAASFGITDQKVHPLISAALSTWSAACKTLPPDSCGLPSCPKRG